MKDIKIMWPWEIKSPIEGPAVMFDVLAASHNIIHLSQKARRLFTVTKNGALEALGRFPDAVLIGETDNSQLYEKLQSKFISSNQPSSVLAVDVSGRDVILITNNGTHTIVELIDKGANPVIVGHWINIDAVTEYIRISNSKRIYLVPSGGREKIFEHIGGKLMEDWYCAEAMRGRINGQSRNYENDFIKSREFIHSVAPQDEDELLLILRLNSTTVVPLCYPISFGIIEVKA